MTSRFIYHGFKHIKIVLSLLSGLIESLESLSLKWRKWQGILNLHQKWELQNVIKATICRIYSHVFVDQHLLDAWTSCLLVFLSIYLYICKGYYKNILMLDYWHQYFDQYEYVVYIYIHNIDILQYNIYIYIYMI